MARRRFQRGSLWQDGDRWKARWREDVRLPNGRDKRVYREQILVSVKDCPTKRLARRVLEDRLKEINSLTYRPVPAETFEQFALRWMQKVMILHKPSSQRSERSVIETHLNPAFGNLAPREISAEGLQTWVATQSLAPKTVRNVMTTLRMMWKSAKSWGYVQHDPFDGLRLPTAVKGNVYHFTIGETLAIIERAQGRWRTFFRVLAETGIRPGELAGLRVIDVGERELRICQSVWQRKVQTPKTRTSVRKFAISQRLALELEELIQNSEPNEYGLVFVTDKFRIRANQYRRTRINQFDGGKPLSMDNFRQRVLNPILDELGIRTKIDALGIKRCGNYAFRHMNATIMDGLGTPLKTRQKRLGHAQPETTLGHYTHALDENDFRAADQIDALLSPKAAGILQ